MFHLFHLFYFFKILVFNFHLEKYFTDNSSTNFSWPVGNEYEILKIGEV